MLLCRLEIVPRTGTIKKPLGITGYLKALYLLVIIIPYPEILLLGSCIVDLKDVMGRNYLKVLERRQIGVLECVRGSGLCTQTEGDLHLRGKFAQKRLFPASLTILRGKCAHFLEKFPESLQITPAEA